MIIFYDEPRVGVFNVEANVYVKGRWLQKEEEFKIIAEMADKYVTRVRESSTPYWNEYGRYETYFTTFDGVHKSRFVRWANQQLSLF